MRICWRWLERDLWIERRALVFWVGVSVRKWSEAWRERLARLRMAGGEEGRGWLGGGGTEPILISLLLWWCFSVQDGR